MLMSQGDDSSQDDDSCIHVNMSVKNTFLEFSSIGEQSAKDTGIRRTNSCPSLCGSPISVDADASTVANDTISVANDTISIDADAYSDVAHQHSDVIDPHGDSPAAQRHDSGRKGPIRGFDLVMQKPSRLAAGVFDEINAAHKLDEEDANRTPLRAKASLFVPGSSQRSGGRTQTCGPPKQTSASEVQQMADALPRASIVPPGSSNGRISDSVKYGNNIYAFVPGSSQMVGVRMQANDSSKEISASEVPQRTLRSLLGDNSASGSMDPVRLGTYTTAMMRNLPVGVTRDCLKRLLDDMGFAGTYNLIYIPTDFSTGRSFGYAFVNLTVAKNLDRFIEVFHGFKVSPRCGRDCMVNVTYSETQGLTANIKRYRDHPVMHDEVPDSWKPALFVGKQRIPFPLPTRRLPPPRRS